MFNADKHIMRTRDEKREARIFRFWKQYERVDPTKTISVWLYLFIVFNLNYLATRTSLLPIRRGFAPCFVSYNKGCTRLSAASDKAYRLLAHGRWFSPGTVTDSALSLWLVLVFSFRGRSWKSPLEHQRRCHRLKKQYEQKTSWSFKLHWTTDRPWLRYDEHEQMMYCTYGTAKNSLRTNLGHSYWGKW
jgi:hypothetical protein